jgi:hypothetical protein
MHILEKPDISGVITNLKPDFDAGKGYKGSRFCHIGNMAKSGFRASSSGFL